MGIKKNHRGYHDWLIQRGTAVIVSVYTLFLLLYLVINISDVHSYALWNDLVTGFYFKISTSIVLLAILAHSSIGLWTVVTDYVPRGLLSVLVTLAITISLIVYLIWGLYVIIA